MKTKLLPAMIGAVLAGGMAAAQADVTVFGHIDTSIVNHDTDVGFVGTTGMPIDWSDRISGEYYRDNLDDTNFKCTTCSIGFKGSEDLGNGLKAIFYLDFQYDIFNRDTTSFTDRDQWLGLAGNFGQVRWGTISTPYKSHGAMIDPLYRTAAQGRDVGLQSFLHRGAGEEGQGRATNTIRWDSPSWNGLQVAAYYTLDSAERNGIYDNPLNLNATEDDDPYGIGVQYSNGGILVFADYITNNGDKNFNEFGDLSAWKVGGKYTLNNFAVMGQYESIEPTYSFSPNNSDGTLDWWTVAGSYTMGNNMLYLGYGSLSGDDLGYNVSSDDADQTAYTLAGTHSLSKRTTIYAAYNKVSQDFGTFINAGLTGAVNPPPPVGTGYGGNVNDPESEIFAIGMKHTF